MKHCKLLCTLALVAVCAFATTHLISQEVGKPEKAGDTSGKGKMSPEEAAMMAKWQTASTPGPQHAELQKIVGTWAYTIKYKMDPAAPWTESTGKSDITSIMGGRFIHDSTLGQTEMGPFTGLGITGYDNVSKKYVSTWLDNMSTGIMSCEGTADASGKVITYMGTCNCPMEGVGKKCKFIITHTDANHLTHDSFSYSKTGEEWKSMEIKYTRIK
ncbi:MAG: DUF1579 domain-containing protein [Planctomycetota bacterium]